MRQSSRSQIHRTNLSLCYLKLDSLINAFAKVLNNIIFTFKQRGSLKQKFQACGQRKMTTNYEWVTNQKWWMTAKISRLHQNYETLYFDLPGVLNSFL